MMMIPGLDVCPTLENVEEGGIQLLSFTGKFRNTPLQIFGVCRSISEFKKEDSLKKTKSWVLRTCFDQNSNKMVCAKRYKNSENDIEMDLSMLKNEIQILSSFDHDNIMKFYELAVGTSAESCYLILECCEYFLSDLMNNKVDGLFERAMVKYIMKQVFEALDYIHKHMIMHRDIHPENFIFKKDGTLKLANFQYARRLSSQDLKLCATCENYHAPEMILKAKRYGPEVDIWAAGCLMAELLLKENLFKGDSTEEIFGVMINNLGVPNDEIWPGYSSLPGLQDFNIERSHSRQCLKLILNRHNPQTKECYEMLQDIFIYDPIRRLTAGECLSCTYFVEQPKGCSLEEAGIVLSKCGKMQEPIEISDQDQ